MSATEVDSAGKAHGRTRLCFLVGKGISGLLGVPGGTHGGAELQMYFIARETARDPRFSVAFLFYDETASGSADVEWADVSAMRPQVERGVPILSRYVNASRLRTSFAQTSADVVIQAGASGMTGIAAKYARQQGMRFAFWMASDGDLTGHRALDAHARQLYLSGLRSSDAIFALSRYQQSELLACFGKESVILPIAFAMPDAPSSAEKDTVLWVASSQNLKQPWLFVDLARAFPFESFTMIMPQNDMAVWERVAGEANGVKNLTLIERVPYDEIQAYFDRAKVFLNTSTIEGFPNTFVQACMGSTPVLSLNISPDDVLQNEGFGRVAGGDFVRLTEDLGELLSNEPLRRRMGAAGFKYAKRDHDLDSVVERFKKTMLEVARQV